jgi:hypothetical protein
MTFVLLSFALSCSGDDGKGGGDTVDRCAGVDCGNGVCVNDGESAVCQCDPGYVDEGLTCVPEGGDADADVDDIDDDGVANDADNCPAYPNADQDVAACTSHAVSGGPLGRFVPALLHDGQVLLLAVYDPGTSDWSPQAWLFDPDTETFHATNGPPVGDHHSGAAITLQDGRVLVAGGESLEDLHRVEIYDPSTGTFSAGPDLPQGGFYPALVLLEDGGVLFVGGQDDGTPVLTTTIFDGASYDPAGSLPAEGPLPLGLAAIRLDDGRVLVTGGTASCGAADPPSNAAALYDPVADDWSLSAGHLAAPRWLHGMSRLPDGKVLVFGGVRGACGEDPLLFDPSSTEEIYDPETDSFSRLPGNSNLHLLGGTVALADGTGFAAGGFSAPDGTPLADTSRYLEDGVADDALFLPQPLATPRAWNIGSLVLLQDGSVLVPGGSTGEFDYTAGSDRVFPYYDVVIDGDHDGIVDAVDFN